VTGKSTVVDASGETGPVTGLGTMEILQDSYGGERATPFVTIGNSVMYLAAIAGLLEWARIQRLVGSSAMKSNSQQLIEED
jgi:apolipoprotein N-acyltransferase